MGEAKFTPGPWVAVALGGSSTVVAPSQPRRNDTSVPPFGYDESRGHCIAYPFIDDDGRTRKDFVCFSHDDARLIAAAPELLGALQFLLNVQGADQMSDVSLEMKADEGDAYYSAVLHARAAIARATGTQADSGVAG
ncbi:MAG TPA: hypothetical protein VF457_07240 [Burkholderiaceae bacterium]